MLEAHQIRVVDEKGDLEKKISALNAFMGGTIFPSLSQAEQDRLTRQYGIMCDYAVVLGERIAAFGK